MIRAAWINVFEDGERIGTDEWGRWRVLVVRAGNMGLARWAGPFSCKPEEGRTCHFIKLLITIWPKTCLNMPFLDK